MHKKTVFITGATSGLGLIVAKKCITKGYIVYATGRNDEVLAELAALGAQTIQADLQQSADILGIVDMLPALDVAILNAGIGTFEAAYQLEGEDIDAMLDVNVRAPIHLAAHIGNAMRKRRQGHLIFIGSQAGKVATKKASVYAASKHAITGFVNGLRMELQDAKVVVTAIYPGPIDTPFIEKADASNTYRAAIAAFLLSPEKVADAVMKTIERPVREVNLPRVMSISSKLYAVAPALVEKLGARFFNKK